MPRNRGAKDRAKQELRKLTNQTPSEEELHDILLGFASGKSDDAANDRSIAIIGGAAVEHSLRLAITSRLRSTLTKAELDDLFSGQNDGPLASFHDRIKIAYALGIITDRIRQKAETIRSVRNIFAHTPNQVSFEDEPIKALCEPLKGTDRMELGSEAAHFAISCAILRIIISDRAEEPRGYLTPSPGRRTPGVLGRKSTADRT